MNSKQRELLNKLKALADKGVGGEKVNAEKKLKQLMEKLGISESDLEDDHEELYVIKIKKGLGEYGRKFLIQLIHYVYGDISNLKGTIDSRELEIFTTADKYLELTALYDFYANRLKEKIALMYRAFIDVNNLYAGKPSDKELTNKELNELLKMKAISANLEKDEFYKKLEEIKWEKTN